MERKLLHIFLAGSPFLLDVRNNELREKENESNVIYISDLTYVIDGYLIKYDRQTKNISNEFGPQGETEIIKLPQLKDLDPEGMAARYGYQREQIKGKSDLDIIMDQADLMQRLSGRQNTIEIVGHTFFVDVRVGELRPKDDFISNGIPLKDIEDYLSEDGAKYCIPYDPVKHEFRNIDFDRISEIPNDLVAIEFPYERVLDPVGYARKYQLDLHQLLREVPAKANFKATIIDWKDTGLYQNIKENRKLQNNKTKNAARSPKKVKRGKRI